MQLISGFIDTYLNLSQAEEKRFEAELSLFQQEEREEVMQIVTSWMRQGIEQGLEQGLEKGLEREKNLILRQLKRKLGGNIEPLLQTKIKKLAIEQLEVLGEALFNFSSVEDLRDWLDHPDSVDS